MRIGSDERLVRELYALRMLAEEGFDLSVLPVGELAPLETRGRLPEVVIIDEHVLYEVRYLSDWTPCEAKRIDTPHVIRQATAEITRLFARASRCSRCLPFA